MTSVKDVISVHQILQCTEDISFDYSVDILRLTIENTIMINNKNESDTLTHSRPFDMSLTLNKFAEGSFDRFHPPFSH